jgi:hypothetical protein
LETEEAGEAGFARGIAAGGVLSAGPARAGGDEVTAAEHADDGAEDWFGVERGEVGGIATGDGAVFEGDDDAGCELVVRRTGGPQRSRIAKSGGCAVPMG